MRGGILIVFLLIVQNVLGTNLADSLSQKDTSNVQKLKIKILPNGYYRPETRIALGTFVLMTFKSDYKDSTAKWSFLKSTFAVTQNKQLSLENDWQIYLKKEKYFLYGSIDLTKFPELFFGLGNNSHKDSSEMYGLSRISHSSQILQKLSGRSYLGINLNTQYLFNEDDTYKFQRFAQVEGARGYFVNGLGPAFIYDSRDNALNSRTGWFHEASVTFHNQFTLSDYNYVNVVLNSRHFYPLLKNWTWANEVYFNFNGGEVPFRSTATLGGFRFLRGYYTGRFRDKNLVFYQTELRIPIYWRIGVVAFGGIGQVAPDLESFSMPEMKVSGGGGLRFLLSKRENANIRIDYGFTSEGGGLYMIFGESF
jgi:hypothetical protein